MGRRLGFTLLIVAILGIGVVVGRAAAPVSDVATVRQAQAKAEADAGLARIVVKLDIRNTPCDEVFDLLREQTGTNLVVNWRALQAAGVNRKALVSLRVTDLPIRRVIELVLAQLNVRTVPLAYHIDRGVIEVSTRGDLSGTAIVRIYDVRDMLEDEAKQRRNFEAPEAPTFQTRSSGNGSGNICFPSGEASLYNGYDETIIELTELIQETVSPEHWREAGGAVGSIRFFGGRLIITSTPEMHAQIDDLLTMIREGNGEVRVP